MPSTFNCSYKCGISLSGGRNWGSSGHGCTIGALPGVPAAATGSEGGGWKLLVAFLRISTPARSSREFTARQSGILLSCARLGRAELLVVFGPPAPDARPAAGPESPGDGSCPAIADRAQCRRFPSVPVPCVNKRFSCQCLTWTFACKRPEC